MKFLVLFASVATIAVVSADVSHLAEAGGYSYDQPISSQPNLASVEQSQGGSIRSVGYSSGQIGQSYSPTVESYQPIQTHSQSHAPAVTQSYQPIQTHIPSHAPAGTQSYQPIQTYSHPHAPVGSQSIEPIQTHSQSQAPAVSQSYEPIQTYSQSHAPIVSHSNDEIIYGKPKSNVFSPAPHQPLIPASGPAYPAVNEGYHKAPASNLFPAFGPAEASGYLPPAQEVQSVTSSHGYNAPVQTLSPVSVEQNLHSEQYSNEVSPSQEYLAPQEHHHLAQQAPMVHLPTHVEHSSNPEYHEDYHHEEQHYEEHQQEFNQPAAVENNSAPTPAGYNYQQEYSAPASQTGGYHYGQPEKRFRYRS